LPPGFPKRVKAFKVAGASVEKPSFGLQYRSVLARAFAEREPETAFKIHESGREGRRGKGSAVICSIPTSYEAKC
jgi:hypothetical protein